MVRVYCLDKSFKNHMVMRMMQDDASSHIAHAILNILKAHRVNVLPRTSKSPDLNFQLSISGISSVW